MKKRNKKIMVILPITIFIIILGVLFAINYNNNSIKGQLDRLLNSNDIEVIFLERNDTESSRFKKFLDNDLKEQGVNYTTINISNATNKDINYIDEKFKFQNSSEVYIIAFKGSENLVVVSSSNFDRAMLMFAEKNLLRDNQTIISEHYYNLGKVSFEKGFLGEAKKNFEKSKGYLDTDEILNYKRFYLVNSDFEYDQNDVRLSLKYSGSYNEDTILVSYQDCTTLAKCFNSQIKTWDARMLSDNKIDTREYNSKDDVPFSESLAIEILSSNQIKIKFNGRYYTLNKTN